MKTKLVLFVTAAICVFAQLVSAQDKVVIRFGHFPNITRTGCDRARPFAQRKRLVRGAARTQGGDPVVYLQRRTISDGSDVRRLARSDLRRSGAGTQRP